MPSYVLAYDSDMHMLAPSRYNRLGEFRIPETARYLRLLYQTRFDHIPSYRTTTIHSVGLRRADDETPVMAAPTATPAAGDIASDDSEQRHGMLLSDQQYEDFVVRLKYKAMAGNSGFYFRAQPVDHPVSVKGFQAEIDADGNDVGGLYETLGRAWVVQPQPEDSAKYYKDKDWNEMTISAIGGDVTVTVNGVQTAVLKDDPSSRRGYFGMQLHGGQNMRVLFKDLEIKEF